jgi:hypothetical protein
MRTVFHVFIEENSQRVDENLTTPVNLFEAILTCKIKGITNDRLSRVTREFRRVFDPVREIASAGESGNISER